MYSVEHVVSAAILQFSGYIFVFHAYLNSVIRSRSILLLETLACIHGVIKHVPKLNIACIPSISNLCLDLALFCSDLPSLCEETKVELNLVFPGQSDVWS